MLLKCASLPITPVAIFPAVQFEGIKLSPALSRSMPVQLLYSYSSKGLELRLLQDQSHRTGSKQPISSALKKGLDSCMEKQKKKIIVDIDNTLWDLAPVLWEHLKAINPEMPEPSEWNDWDFWGRYVPMKDLYQVIRNIHMQ